MIAGPGRVYIKGIKSEAAAELSDTIKTVVLKTSDNLSWLSEGDIVLLKPALNSRYPYPATTHPESVHAIAELLEERGAQVVVGDQPGIRDVLNDETGAIKGSSKTVFEQSGMSRGARCEFTGFDQDGWGEGYFRYQTDKTRSWPNGFYLTNWVRKADHIINLPRVSTHSMAGVTLGFKNLVGLLREDSRMEFHANGPFYSTFKGYAKSVSFSYAADRSNGFYEKMTEISLATQSKLRLTVFTATKAQVTLGPDKYLFPIGKKGVGSAQVITPDTGLVFASSDPVSAEVFALAFLIQLCAKAPWHKKLFHKLVMLVNGQAKEPRKHGVWANPFITHALKHNLGSRSVDAEYEDVPDALMSELDGLMTSPE